MKRFIRLLKCAMQPFQIIISPQLRRSLVMRIIAGVVVSGIVLSSTLTTALAENTRTVTPDAPVLPTEPQIPNHRFNVGDFGANPDDGIDDTAAIQKAIDHVSEAGGGQLVFDRGRYDILIGLQVGTEKVALLPRSGVALVGRNAKTTTLRLADNQGNYDSIFYVDRTAPVSDFAIRDLMIDQNGPNNLVSSNLDLYPPEGGAVPRFIWVSRAAQHVAFDRVHFTNILGVNTINFGTDPNTSTEGKADLIVRDSVFDELGWTGFDFDHSTVYTQTDRVLVTGNTFRSRYGAGTHSARAAIETHGADQTITNNIVDGFVIGINVTGAKLNSPRQVISHNKFLNVARGIYLWAYAATPLSEVEISNNLITVNVDAWLASKVPSRKNLGGILTNGYTSGSFTNLVIRQNEIRFINYSEAQESYFTKPNEGGIVFTTISKAPGFIATNVEVSYNTIIDSLGSGIASDMPHTGEFVVSKNSIVNPLRTPNAFPAGERGAISLTGSYENATVSQNRLTISDLESVEAVVVATEACAVSATFSKNHFNHEGISPVIVLPENPDKPVITANAFYTKAGKDQILQSLDFSTGPWAAAESFDHFLVMNTDQESPIRTNVYLLWDDENLYVGYENFDDNLDEMIIGKEIKNAWWVGGTNDSVETYITGNPNEAYLGFFTNPNGLKFARYRKAGHDIDWQVSTHIGSDRWNVIQVIPFAEIGIDPIQTETIAGFFFRNYHGNNVYLGWDGGAPWSVEAFRPIRLIVNE